VKNIMNTDGTLEHGDDSPISGGVFVFVALPSQKVSAAGKKIYSGPFDFIFAGGDADGFAAGSVVTTGPVTIQPTAEKVFADGQAVIRDEDFVLMNCIGVFDPPAVPATGPVAGNVVVVAGQQKVSAA
jgi:hypothetical protein